MESIYKSWPDQNLQALCAEKYEQAGLFISITLIDCIYRMHEYAETLNNG
jgi:hypothetical protein